MVLRGPERQLGGLAKVTVQVNVQGITGAVEQYVNISGLPQGVTSNPQGVKVSVMARPVPAPPGAAVSPGGQGNQQAAGAPSSGSGQAARQKEQ